MDNLPTNTVIFDHAVRRSEETALAVIELAIERGWQDADAAHLVDHHWDHKVDFQCKGDAWKCWVRSSYGHTDLDMNQAIMDVAYDATNSAEEYLNEHCVPEGFYAGNHPDAGAFGVWEIDHE